MNKTALINEVAEKNGMTNTAANNVLDSVLAIIQNALTSGQDVVITGFGKFAAPKREARIGRNPRTGQPVDVPAKRVVKFTPGKGLKEAVNQ